ncbi:M4 family metallopeptidase [Streptomyces caniscabiei]|uniref:M4 family metallopeptidase n=1 Tax=Streptomyces caniscabiei TaxID=2746961 RepID=A0ABU4MM35_9ACTN|nr:M4 family metallopeptidase [Streptomyces caniscabiei]MBE4733741.1 M4 family metallopeptidase [Streptomyces caniscabiei]MBE4754918.1 M4 family metallopeptidase [Streptomyces caniscabiei]MBE4768262.1 M4 family metallopeptidase [Streptomyces caniscabiei]MBE4782236.1 M4 family metallopeptidase [Streptomyces caniscabiei]MBE4793524.1 M4 family metallopeptidase [Streptomyces caniscabiei]
MRSTPHRRTTATAALVVAAAVLAVAVPGAPAIARGDGGEGTVRPAAARADRGALPAQLTPAQRATLVRQAEKATDRTEDRLDLGSQEELRVRDVVKDADGTVHTRYERTFAGLPVLGGDLVVHTARSGAVESVTRAYKPELKVSDLSPEVSRATAEKQALKAAKEEGSTKTAPDSSRKVVWAAKGTPTLAYETVVSGFQHDDTPSELHVVTDAQTGKKLYEYEAVHTGTGNTRYSGTVTLGTSQSGSSYTLTDAERGNHRTYNLNRGSSGTGTLFSGADDVWGDGTTANLETAGADAHYGAALTWDYYKNVHGRNGLRNDGVAPYSRVHYGNNYVNAFWQDSCFCMTYGDGSGNANPLTSIDVAAHEMTHGLTSVTAGLNYSGESGGLNEATSDIFAAAVEFAAGNSEDVGDYLVGEKIDINGDGTPLRYMDKPSKDGSSRDYWSSTLGNVDVHYSSGPANHWYYLASEGSGAKVVNGVSYDSPTFDGLPVTPIGRDAAEKIWFRALTTYMTSTTNYAGARTATLQAAADLYGLGTVTYNNTANAWAAINVGSRILDGVTVVPPAAQYSLVGQSVTLDVQASSTNPGALSYAATGLPAGLSLDAATGRISGTPTAAGNSTVTVTVTDAAGETGTASFAWRVDEEGNQSVFENTADYQIPDNSTVESPINVNRAGTAPSTLSVDVNIVHTWRGDLVVDLVAPDGTAYRLKNSSSSDSADNVIATYTVDASSETAAGTWKLRVQDVASLDTGYINSWKLTF